MNLLLTSTLVTMAAAQHANSRLRTNERNLRRGNPNDFVLQQRLDDDTWNFVPSETESLNEVVRSDFGRDFAFDISVSALSMSMIQTIQTDAPSMAPTPTQPKPNKEKHLELVAYSWNLPAEYTGYFQVYEAKGMGLKGVDDLELIDEVQLGTGTSGSDSTFLSKGRYIIVVVNQDQTVGYCCEGSEPGWIQFTYGGIEYNQVTDQYQERKDKDKFIAEFHRKPKKVDVGPTGAEYIFDITL